MKLTAVGDFMLDHAFSTRQPPYDRTFQVLSRADLVFANLETPLGTRGHPREKLYTFRSNPSLTRVLTNAGVDIVTVANNHMLDYGEEALNETLETLSRADIHFVGAGRNIIQAEKPVVLEKNGVRVAFLGLAATLPLGAAASKERAGLAPVHVTTGYEIDPTLTQEQPGNPPKVRTRVEPRDEERICQNVREARRRADHVVVGIHWGVAFTKERAEYQQPLGHKMIDAGASIVVGHHSHVRQGVESYNGGVILYSLGDFVFHDRIDMGGESGMMATAELRKRGVLTLELLPITIEEKTGLPVLGGPKNAKQLLDEMKQSSIHVDLRLENNSVKIRI